MKRLFSRLLISCLLALALLVQSLVPAFATVPLFQSLAPEHVTLRQEAATVIGSGDDPLSKAIAGGVGKTVALSAEKYPQQTAAVLGVLEATGDALDATITYVDDATGNIVSIHWNDIPEHTRNQIKGGAGIASIMIPAGSIKALGKLKKTGKLPGRINKKIDGILKPGGNFVGYVKKGTTSEIRTVSVSEFTAIKNTILDGATEAGSYAGGKGNWYNLPGGGRVGVRVSSNSGITLDIDIPGYPPGFKIHQK